MSDLQTKLVVGLEIHVELATRSKMFTTAPNVAHPDFFDAAPNTLTDPVVLGMPGTLPVVNRRAVEMSALVGMALGSEIATQTKWDRKSYSYPDLPKNYQISQYDKPVCGAGVVQSPESEEPGAELKPIRITRAHLEEDAGKLMHEAPGGAAIDHSIIDLNRAGTPLLEIVTEPDFQTAEQTVAFAKMLRLICLHLGVSQAIMQRGHMRFEPNINVEITKDGQTYKTPIVEIKNLNSFKALGGAIAYEHQRQVDKWVETGEVMGARSKSTRGWDADRQVTTPQREKEDADEYRYFPDPDLGIVEIDDNWKLTIQKQMPQLPLARQTRYTQELGLSHIDGQTLIEDPALCQLYDQIVNSGGDGKKTASVLLNYGARCANERGCMISQLPVGAQQIKQIVDLITENKIGSNGAGKLFELCCDSPEQSALNLAQTNNLLQVSDDKQLEEYVDQVLSDPKNKQAADDIRAGKGKAIGALMGAVMRLSKGQANAQVVQKMIREKLENQRN